jgi:hypothetical protein
MSDTVTLEYLSASAPDRRRAPYVVAAVIGLLALIAAGFLWWSDSVRSSANEELLATFEESAARSASGERAVQGMLAYATPLIWSADVPEDVRAGLRGVVEESAAVVAVDLLGLRERAAATMVLPWQQLQLEAQAELVALIDAQRARFDGIARDARDIDRVLADGPLPTGAAAEALRSAGAE